MVSMSSNLRSMVKRQISAINVMVNVMKLLRVVLLNQGVAGVVAEWLACTLVTKCRTCRESRKQPTEKPHISLKCSQESTTRRPQPKRHSLGKWSSLWLLLLSLKPWPMPRVSQEIRAFAHATCWLLTGAGLLSLIEGSASVKRRSSFLFLRSILASWSRWMLMNRTSVTRRRSRHRSATSTMLVQRLSSSVVTTRLGRWMGSMEHSSKTFSQFTQNRRNCFSNLSESPFVPL
mmetsp:Transcript_45871/g.146484  ORF Transcript_45871/g.146484 Transcript_45871/m.146484 type:complete len:233 (+) Transcript_45871:723-1421(+)